MGLGLYKTCNFCNRVFENPNEWYSVDGGHEVCQYCKNGFEDDELEEIND